MPQAQVVLHNKSSEVQACMKILQSNMKNFIELGTSLHHMIPGYCTEVGVHYCEVKSLCSILNSNLGYICWKGKKTFFSEEAPLNGSINSSAAQLHKAA